MVSLWSEEVVMSLLTGLSTLIGTILVLLIPVQRKMIAFSLGISGGVMLVVAYFTLLPAAVSVGQSWHVALGGALAILFMLLIHSYPFSKVKEGGESSGFLRLGVLLVITVIAHNIPEGAAIGLGFHTEHHVGLFLSIALAIHNVPEGIGLAAPLVMARRHPLSILGLSLLCGLALPFGTWLGLSFLVESGDWVSIGLMFAAVIMVWILVCEICPRAFSLSRITFGFGLGVGALFMYIMHLFH